MPNHFLFDDLFKVLILKVDQNNILKFIKIFLFFLFQARLQVLPGGVQDQLHDGHRRLHRDDGNLPGTSPLLRSQTSHLVKQTTFKDNFVSLTKDTA